MPNSRAATPQQVGTLMTGRLIRLTRHGLQGTSRSGTKPGRPIRLTRLWQPGRPINSISCGSRSNGLGGDLQVPQFLESRQGIVSRSSVVFITTFTLIKTHAKLKPTTQS